MSISIELYSEELRESVVETWESSVRATHHFLKEEDIRFFKTFVSGLDFNSMSVYCGLTEEREMIGFLGVDNHKLEMLFLHPQHIGKGYGKLMLDYAINNLEANALDVNEDNQHAVEFYKKHGFVIEERMPVDGTGKPYPILKMKLNTTTWHLSEPRIEVIDEKILVGQRKTMSLIHNSTGELWASFMKTKNSITELDNATRYSLQNYPAQYFTNFNPSTEFEKWAAVEFLNEGEIPPGMELMKIPAGKYAVFNFKGNNKYAPEVFRYIFQQWLPSSGLGLDDRPHFELVGEKYRNGQDNSEEEIWIPVK